MINIQNKVDCCGCNACGDACSKQAITYKTDHEGFWYPEVDKGKCINCGLCEKVCPQLHVDELKHNEFEKPVCFAAIHKNIETRFASTTGGLFSALAAACSLFLLPISAEDTHRFRVSGNQGRKRLHDRGEPSVSKHSE